MSEFSKGEAMRELAMRLDALVVFRDLLHDPVISSLGDLVREPGVSTYAAFVAALMERGGSAGLSGYVREAVCDDENPYTRLRAAGEEVPASMRRAAEEELETFQQVADLTVDDLRSGLPGERFLPAFEEGERVELAHTYHARVEDMGRYGFGIYARYRMFLLDDDGAIEPVKYPDPVRLYELVDYEREKRVILDNTRALLAGRPAANILLTGDAGTGKSSTVKAVVNELAGEGLRILQVRKDQLHQIPELLDALTANPLKFILFIDDLSFSANDDNYAALKAILEGSVSAKSGNVVVYATSNRRHLVKESFSDREGDEVHRNDTMQEIISLSERFGIHVSFYRPDKRTYLDIVRSLAAQRGLAADPEALDAAAEKFALRRGGRSARGARQFVDAVESGSVAL